MRKRVVSLGLALVMALGVSGVSEVREVRAEYKAVKVEKVGKEVKSKRGEMPKFLKESGVKAVKDDGEHVWIEDEWGVKYPSKNTYYTLEEYTDESYGLVFGDRETHDVYVKAKGLDSSKLTGYDSYYVPVDLKNWKDSIAEAKKYGVYAGVYVYNPEELEGGGARVGVDGKKRQLKQYVVIQEVSKGNYVWVGTYKSRKEMKDVRSVRMSEQDDYQKAVKYKLVQKVERDGVSVKVEPVSVLSKYLNTEGLQAPIKVEFGDFDVYTKSGASVARGTKGKVKIPVGVKAGKYDYILKIKLKDKKGKVKELLIHKGPVLNLKKTVSIKDYAKGYKPKVKVEKKKAYLVFGNKIKRVVVNGQEIESKAATTKMNVSRIVKKNGTYDYEVYTEDGLVGTGKVTVKGLKK